MKIRNYNIYFSTHTVSGIIICAILYVIFFAGSFSFFKDEISAWQSNNSYHNTPINYAKYDELLDSLQTGMNLKGRDIQFYLQKSEAFAYINISSSKDTLLPKQDLGNNDPKYFNYDFLTQKSGDYQSSYDMGEFLYRLHFLAQLNQVPIRIGIAPFGYLVAGITSFLFLFALITGLLLHWEKIVSNFFVFRPFSKWKTVWTDMHTALGVIGFPFQFIFALTGIFLILNTVLALPFEKLLYENQTEKMYQDLGFGYTSSSEYTYKALEKEVLIAPMLNNAKNKWPNSEFKRIALQNFGDQNMQIIIESDPNYAKNFSGSGLLIIQAKDQKIIAEKSPIANPNYIDQVRALLYRLHFGDFGGYPLKMIYFILGIMGCLVITSGILI
ncbi:MAG: PepSY-associated TM helix domain-containing protein, partial [Sphingobacterium sp.]